MYLPDKMIIFVYAYSIARLYHKNAWQYRQEFSRPLALVFIKKDKDPMLFL